jgi:hypothetical protein
MFDNILSREEFITQLDQCREFPESDAALHLSRSDEAMRHEVQRLTGELAGLKRIEVVRSYREMVYQWIGRMEAELAALRSRLEAAERDTKRLDWKLANRHMSLSPCGTAGEYAVWDRSRGLVIAGKGKTPREAIDDAIAASEGKTA